MIGRLSGQEIHNNTHKQEHIQFSKVHNEYNKNVNVRINEKSAECQNNNAYTRLCSLQTDRLPRWPNAAVLELCEPDGPLPQAGADDPG